MSSYKQLTYEQRSQIEILKKSGLSQQLIAKAVALHAVQPRALSKLERTVVVDILQSEEYCDQPPAAVYQSLLEKNQHLCSVSTMHRILRSEQAAGDRRNQRPAQHNAIPRLLATAPHDVWTWDITKLPLVRRGVYLSLYVVLDLYSRFVIAWMV